MRIPEFTIYCGPMWGGKTSRLLAHVDRLQRQKKNVICFKPKIDDRYSVGEISTHNGIKIKAVQVSNGKEILDYTDKYEGEIDAIAVDELFMIDGGAEALLFTYKDCNISVIVSSLDISASGKPFSEMSAIFPFATRIEKCPAICAICQQDAFFTKKKGDSKELIEIGGDTLYEPRCYNHFFHCR